MVIFMMIVMLILMVKSLKFQITIFIKCSVLIIMSPIITTRSNSMDDLNDDFNYDFHDYIHNNVNAEFNP